MERTVQDLFNSNLLKHQKDLSGVINKTVIIGSYVGVGFYVLLKMIGIMSDFEWSNLLYFSIPLVLNTFLLGISNLILKRKSDQIYVNVFMYLLILVTSINLFAICMFIPYRDAWGAVILLFFLSAYYLDFKVTTFGIILSLFICIFTFYNNTAIEELSIAVPNILTRIQMLSFGSLTSFISTYLGRKMLLRSCRNEFDLNRTLENIQKVNSQVKNTITLLGASSEHITELSSLQYSGAETTSASVSAISDEMINTSNNVQECANLIKTLSEDTVVMKDQTTTAIGNSEQLKLTAMNGRNSIENAVDKIAGIKESAIKTYDSAVEMDILMKKIQTIVGDIQGIAEETKLLSLNASIEAARVGEYGAGFTVVAEAIRKLSEQSQKSLGNIADVLSDMNQHETTVTDLVGKVDEGVGVIRGFNEYYSNIIHDIEKTMQSLDTINNLADKQEDSVTTISEFIGRVKDMSEVVSENIQETSATTQQTFASCEELLQSAKKLDSMSKELKTLILALQ